MACDEQTTLWTSLATTALPPQAVGTAHLMYSLAILNIVKLQCRLDMHWFNDWHIANRVMCKFVTKMADSR